MIVGRWLRIVRFAVIVMAMSPEHQLFQHKENQDAEEDRRRRIVDIAGVLKGVRQDFEENCAEESPDRVRNHNRNARDTDEIGDCRGAKHTERSADKAHQENPGQRGHEDVPKK